MTKIADPNYRYEAMPVIVNAYRITEILPKNADGVFHVMLENGQRKLILPPMVSRYNPEIGDYFVIQSDGYEYLNPRDVFERKYRPIDSAAPAAGEAA